VSALSPRAVLVGALVDLVIFVPLVVGLAILKHHDIATQESYLWVVAAVAVFVAPLAGGAAAARHRDDTPLMNGAAAAGLAFLAFLIIPLVAGRGVNAVQALLFLMITVSMGVFGAYLGFRRTRHP